jgi:hypothetical protein
LARLIAFGRREAADLIGGSRDGTTGFEREAMLARLPCDLVIEHIGKFLEPVGFPEIA